MIDVIGIAISFELSTLGIHHACEILVKEFHSAGEETEANTFVDTNSMFAVTVLHHDYVVIGNTRTAKIDVTDGSSSVGVAPETCVLGDTACFDGSTVVSDGEIAVIAMMDEIGEVCVDNSLSGLGIVCHEAAEI